MIAAGVSLDRLAIRKADLDHPLYFLHAASKLDIIVLFAFLLLAWIASCFYFYPFLSGFCGYLTKKCKKRSEIM